MNIRRKPFNSRLIFPRITAVLLGGLHLVIVGMPYLKPGGGGESSLYILYIDLPLFLITNLLAPALLYNEVSDFLLFPVLGTVMYAGIGYLLGRLVVLGRDKFMESKAQVKTAIVLGVLHCIIVGIPLIRGGGQWERSPHIMFIDFPLFLPANILATKLLDTSAAFNYILFPFLGSILYAGVGYLIVRLAMTARSKQGN